MSGEDSSVSENVRAAAGPNTVKEITKVLSQSGKSNTLLLNKRMS